MHYRGIGSIVRTGGAAGGDSLRCSNTLAGIIPGSLPPPAALHLDSSSGDLESSASAILVASQEAAVGGHVDSNASDRE